LRHTAIVTPLEPREVGKASLLQRAAILAPGDKIGKPNVSRLTSGTSIYGAPSFSPDGRWIAFALGPNPVEANIFKRPVGGSESVQLTFLDHARPTHPAWSPDGQRIAFISDQNGTPKVSIINASGGPAQVLENTNASRTNRVLAWWPSSDIVYQQSDFRNYLRINEQTHEEKPIIQHDQSVGTVPDEPVYSPDGKKIAVFWKRIENGGLWTISLEPYSEMLLQLGRIHPLGWSPDGQYVYALRRDAEFTGREIIKIQIASPNGVSSVATLPGDVDWTQKSSVQALPCSTANKFLDYKCHKRFTNQFSWPSHLLKRNFAVNWSREE
jgi:Tol biopolymer transport system component